MQELANREPGYNWEVNMGYPTKEHYQAIYELGMSFHHRKSFNLMAKHLQPSLWASGFSPLITYLTPL
jgi:ribonuclease HII